MHSPGRSAGTIAIEPLKAKGYADQYRTLGQPIHFIGVEFSSDSHNIVGFEVEHV